MPAPGLDTVDQYIAAQPAEVRGILEEVRSAILKALPKAEEIISYKIPAYRLPGGVAIFFAAWKQHWSLYPATERLRSALGDALAPYEVEKGTIRFPFGERVPLGLIARIAKLRAKEVAAGATEKSAGKQRIAASSNALPKGSRPRRSPANSPGKVVG
jgi:uncharacterized protein YdhG (YjbR/CyaY superfamily)